MGEVAEYPDCNLKVVGSHPASAKKDLVHRLKIPVARKIRGRVQPTRRFSFDRKLGPHRQGLGSRIYH